MTGKPDTRAVVRSIFTGRMLIAALMGFAAGLPLLLTGSVLQAWMTESGVDLGTIGLFALVGLPYTLKFAWAPLMDRYVPALLGRRRGWLLGTQVAVILAIVGLAMTDPSASPAGVAFAALLLTFFSASQDIVIDAYRRESLSDDEQGLGGQLYVQGYRLGMLLASGGGLILADLVSFSTVYLIMAGAMLVGVVTTLLAPEPPSEGAPATLLHAVVQPFEEYFQRRDAVLLGVFILLYKIGDQMASQMTTPFYLDLGYSKTEIGAVVKLFGFWATIAGSLVGGVLMLRLGLYRSLVVFGVLQAVSTLGFAWLTVTGPSNAWLAAVIAFENLTQGMGTAAYFAFMAVMTNRKFTATQYALFTSLIGIPRVFATAPTGYMVQFLGWAEFFIVCALVAIPGLLLLRKFRSWMQHDESPGSVEVRT